MKIQVVGNSPAVDELIGLLRLGGYAASKTDGTYSFHLDELITPLCTTCRQAKSPIDYIIIDGVDCELESRATNYISELGVPKIVLDRVGPNHSDRRLEVKLPSQYADMVALGLYRAIDKMLNKSVEVSPEPRVKPRSKFFGLLPILLSAFVINPSFAQDQNSIIRFWNPTLDAIVAAGDVANNALRVNMVAGTISGADGAILDGAAPSIKATVFDYTLSNPLAVRQVDLNGTAITIPSFQDNTTFTSAGSYVFAVGFYTGADAMDSGEIGAAKMSNARVLYTALAEASTGNLINIVNDGVAYNLAVSAGGRGADGAAALGYPVRIAGKDGSGNTQDIITDSAGELQVDVLTMPTTTVTATNLDVQIGGSDSLTIGTFPDNEPINVAQKGGSAVAAGPCEREVPLYIQISQTTGTQLIAGTASERVYVCSIAIVTATAQNIALVDGTGSVCATVPTGLLGGSTAATGQNFAANGGWVLPFNPGAWAKTSTDADNICLLQSSTGQISGIITYVSVPNI